MLKESLNIFLSWKSITKALYRIQCLLKLLIHTLYLWEDNNAVARTTTAQCLKDNMIFSDLNYQIFCLGCAHDLIAAGRLQTFL